ncbi:thiamine pyrophosphate-binding protein [Pseudactinotalea sp. Z1732]|uniref:thiamine pyrophosphate-binding protein n=1 Tax=Pseudactinotalea sp. Z1732 TaxID=3413026 RepID=UPI003C7B7AF5
MSTDTPTVSTHTPTVSIAVAEVISERAGHLFGLLGNGNAHLVSHLTSSGFPFTSARHEVATVTMADSYHRATGQIAAATTTYGAGFTNTYTGLAEAARARVPLVLITGDAPSTGLRTFDIDQTAAAAAVGVATLTVTPADAAALTHHAFDLALQTRRPVVLAIPHDLATVPLPDADQPAHRAPSAETPGEHADPGTRTGQKPPPLPAPIGPPAPSAEELDRIAEALRAARRPLILAGRGTVLARAGHDVRALGDRLGALFMTSVMAASVIDSPWNLGIAGGFTRAHRLDVARRADVVLVLGASLNPFQTRYGTLVAEGTRVIRVDDESPADHPMVTDAVHANLVPVVRGLLERLRQADEARTWRAHVPQVATAQFRSAQIDRAEFTPAELAAPEGTGTAAGVEFCTDGRLNPRVVAAALDGILPADRSVVTDGGNFIGWAPMYFSVPDPHAMVLLGTAFQSIGLGFGSAAGVAAARPDRTTVLVTGDGGALMGLADLETLMRTAHRAVVVVFNDAAYGAELHQYAAAGLHDAAMRIDEVDFAALGRAFGAEGIQARTLADLDVLRQWLATHTEGVFILDVSISTEVVADFLAASLEAKSTRDQR